MSSEMPSTPAEKDHENNPQGLADTTMLLPKKSFPRLPPQKYAALDARKSTQVFRNNIAIRTLNMQNRMEVTLDSFEAERKIHEEGVLTKDFAYDEGDPARYKAPYPFEDDEDKKEDKEAKKSLKSVE